MFWSGFDFCVKRKIIGLRSVKRSVGCLHPRIKNSYSLRVYIIAAHSLISSACVKFLEFAEIILCVPMCDCNNAAPMPKFEASHSLKFFFGSGRVFVICSLRSVFISSSRF